MNNINLNGFKAYDVRGRIGEEITDELCYKVARALAKHLNAKKVCVGCDNRLSSEGFKQQLIKGFNDSGVDVLDLGLTGTEEVYFGTSYYDLDGGIQVTASHNPKDYNGLKIVSKGSVAMGLDSGLKDLMEIIKTDDFATVAEHRGTCSKSNHREEYYNKIKEFFSEDKLAKGKKIKVLFNCGNGTSGSLLQFILDKLIAAGANIEYKVVHQESDGNFPNGIPNPLLVENRKVTSDAVLEFGADLGVAFDGDFDRCFFFDEKGQFLDGYYVCGLLSQAFLKNNPNQKICYEPRLLWNTVEVIERNGGEPVLTKSGHAYIKATLRKVNAIYGGEMSAHHYFRDFYYCDSGMIPWLLMLGLVQESDKKVSDFVTEMSERYPCSDELNFKVSDTNKVFTALEEKYKDVEKEVMTLDGISYDFGKWRVNVRSSNTEPLLRINIETRGDKKLLSEKIEELTKLVKENS